MGTAATPHTEIELKFQVPPAQLEAVRREVLAAGGQPLRLQARYFDTPDRALARAAMALRLRREGEEWVQTLKGRGDGFMQRLEHEVVLGADEPPLDIARHDGHPAGAALRRALGDAAPAMVFGTDVRRTRALVAHEGAEIELALDEGEIRAGDARAAMSELEFELKAGSVAALLSLAGDWVQRHGLWLDPRTKAERGERLARGLTTVPAVDCAGPTLADALRQLLGNACELADEGGGTPAQLRALHRALEHCAARTDEEALRAALLAFQGQWPAQPSQAGPLLRGAAFNRLALRLVAEAARP